MKPLRLHRDERGFTLIDLILVIQALIVVFIAAPALIKAIYRVRTGRAADLPTTGWGT